MSIEARARAVARVEIRSRGTIMATGVHGVDIPEAATHHRARMHYGMILHHTTCTSTSRQWLLSVRYGSRPENSCSTRWRPYRCTSAPPAKSSFQYGVGGVLDPWRDCIQLIYSDCVICRASMSCIGPTLAHRLARLFMAIAASHAKPTHSMANFMTAALQRAERYPCCQQLVPCS